MKIKYLFLFVLFLFLLNCGKEDAPFEEYSNSSPVAEDDTATTMEDIEVIIKVLENDTDSDGTIDLSSLSIITEPTNGTTSIDLSTGEITYTPNSNYVGTDTFTYSVCDDYTTPLCDSATVSITIVPSNNDITPPCDIVENIVYSTTINSITMSWDPCIDPEGEEVTYALKLFPLSYDCDNNWEYDNGFFDFFTTETTFTFENLSPIRRYIVNIVAQDPAGNSSTSVSNWIVTLPVDEMNGDINLQYQYAVDLFQGHQFSIVNGDVTIIQPCWDFGIYTSIPVSNLSALQGIEEIHGDLILESFKWHTIHDLSGLQSLKKITGKLIINGEDPSKSFINDISQLCNLIELGGFEMELNSISSISGLDVLQHINGDFILKNNYNLDEILGFPNLETIEGSFELQFQPLSNISGFNSFLNIYDRLYIKDNDNLTNLDFLSNLSLIECDGTSEPDLVIINNSNLSDFCGLTNFFTNGGLCNSEYSIQGNGYNPTHIQIINGDCNL